MIIYASLDDWACTPSLIDFLSPSVFLTSSTRIDALTWACVCSRSIDGSSASLLLLHRTTCTWSYVLFGAGWYLYPLVLGLLVGRSLHRARKLLHDVKVWKLGDWTRCWGQRFAELWNLPLWRELIVEFLFLLILSHFIPLLFEGKLPLSVAVVQFLS